MQPVYELAVAYIALLCQSVYASPVSADQAPRSTHSR